VEREEAATPSKLDEAYSTSNIGEASAEPVGDAIKAVDTSIVKVADGSKEAVAEGNFME
jgi:hypothetical protein